MNKLILLILLTIIVLISSIERFRVIQDSPSYEISNKGRVRNIKTRRILKTTLTNSGYKLVGMRAKGNKPNQYIHRLVA